MDVGPFAVEPLHVLTGQGAAAMDRWAITERGVPEAALMERAGAAAATVVHHLHPAGRVGVLAGKGNNGGDGMIVARTLTAWGREVVLVAVGRPAAASDPLLRGWPVATTASDAVDRNGLEGILSGCDVLVDGVLGTGTSGAPRGEPGRVLEILADVDRPIVALDLPSGVDADTGAAPGPCVQAGATVALGWPKLGTLMHPGRARSGRLLAVEIGFPPLRPADQGCRLLTPAWAAAHRPLREPETHKNRVGALTVVAGRPGMAGAALLAARAALRTGAGYVRIVTHSRNREIVQTALPEAVFVDASDRGAVDEALGSAAAIAVGPGLGTDGAASDLLDRVLASDRPRVVDADGLTLLARAGMGVLDPRTVLTPHPGEAARLLGCEVDDVQRDRLGSVAGIQRRTGAVALLKGTPSLVRGAGGLWVDSVATSDLAVAGMGDTLTGAVGAFLAQGCAPEVAAGLGLVCTGRAAARAGRGPGLQAADVPDHLPDALSEVPPSRGLPVPGLLLDLEPPR
ncbi:MAG TPA: NAD(P)H-hydrate dehydratase [Longimicrobiales bacterium]|nr:NAD(P)H-hydrate dehydratase [Longimicrobiales bacterium]